MKLNKSKLFQLKKALLSLAEISTEEGVMLIVDGDMEVGMEVFVNGDEGLVPANDGEYTYNGQKITVEGGIVKSIVDVAMEQPTPDPEPETDPEPTPDPETDPEPTPDPEPETEPEPAEDVEALKTRIAELEALVEELKKKLEEPVAESVEEDMRNEEKKNEKTSKRDYAAMMRKAREIKQNRK